MAVVLLLALAGRAPGQVDCSNPDNLCTGDPCVIPEIEPANPCVANFGQRELVIEGLRNVESVELGSGGRITVAGPIKGRPGVGGHLVLASGNRLTLNGRIEFEGESTVQLSGIDELTLDAPIRLTGEGDTPVESQLLLRSGDGDVEIRAPITNDGGTDAIEVQAAGIGVRSRITSRRNGIGAPPPLVMGALGVLIESALSIHGPVDIGAEGTIRIAGPIRAAGAHLTITASEPIDGVVIDAPIKSTGRSNGSRCGAIAIRGGKGPPIINAPVVCAGRAGGEGITIEGSSITVNDTLKTVSKDADGGDIVLNAHGEGDGVTLGDLRVTGQIIAGGSHPGDVLVNGGDVRFEDASVRSSARSGGGAQRYTATNGNILLQGDFDARKSGTIQAITTDDITTDGDFGVGPGGCIGLSAGGTVATGSSTFDQSVVTTCP